MALALIEAIAGADKAEQVARQLGLARWDARHDSKAFRLTRPFAMSVLRNVLAFWNRERLSIELRPGVDEVSLALVADMWSRTYRSKAVTFGAHSEITQNGLRIIPDETSASGGQVFVSYAPPPRALDETLQSIAERYGAPTADVVAMQLEYPRR